jgi:hypothetical protein
LKQQVQQLTYEKLPSRLQSSEDALAQQERHAAHLNTELQLARRELSKLDAERMSAQPAPMPEEADKTKERPTFQVERENRIYSKPTMDSNVALNHGHWHSSGKTNRQTSKTRLGKSARRKQGLIEQGHRPASTWKVLRRDRRRHEEVGLYGWVLEHNGRGANQ